MSWRHERVMAMCLVAWIGVGLEDAWAQDKAKEPPRLGWSNSTDLSLVVTVGNSAAQTWGFRPAAACVGKDARFELEGNFVRSNKSDDRFFQVAPDLEFPAEARLPTRQPRSSSPTRPWMSPITASAEATNATSPRDTSGTRARAGTATTTPAS